jgi:threonine dehydrogenase-like Zn-dependent dehydrogenase
MRALVFDKKLFYSRDYPVPARKEREALIKVSSAGICRTDLEIIKGYMDFEGIPGHEFAGVVEDCSDESLLGKRVVGEINISCDVCAYCSADMRNHCPHRTVLGILNKNGAFADYVTLPVVNLHQIPDSVSDEEAVFVEPLAAVFEITGQVSIKEGDKVCVLGDGRIGLLAGQVLSLTGCSLTVIGKHKEKLSMLEKRGIETQLATDTMTRDFDFVIECTGSQSGFETALTIVKPRGTVILKTTVAGRRDVDLNSVVIDEITVLGSRCGPFEPAVEALRGKKVDVLPLVGKTFSLDEGVEAINYASENKAIKVLMKV